MIEVEKIADFIANKELGDICRRFEEYQKLPKFELGFNVFKLLSDKYKKEHFHTNILTHYLNPKANHNSENKYLINFIKLLNYLRKNGAINEDDYQLAEVKSEENYIDIVIKSESSNHAIIIENKINNATDQERQIPRYVESLKSKGYVIDAIAYISLDGYKRPNTDTWEQEEKENILGNVFSVAGFTGEGNDIYSYWNTCSTDSCHIPDLILKQYTELLKSLSGATMENSILEGYYNIIVTNHENLETINSIIKMNGKLLDFRRDRIMGAYNNNDITPFTKISILNDRKTIVFDNFVFENLNFSIDLKCEEDGYYLQFFNKPIGIAEVRPDVTKSILDQIKLRDEFAVQGARFTKWFPFPDEEARLYLFIDEFKGKLKDLLAR